MNSFCFRKITLYFAIAGIFAGIFLPIAMNAQTTRVLFIGNSLTGTNNLPQQFKNIALAAGKSIYVDDASMGGATLQNHLNSPSTINKIQQGNWDYVVLQEQSQLPSWVNQRDSMFYPFAKSLDSIIHIYNPCGQTVFFMTFAHRNGDLGILQNAGFDTYWAMQQRIRDGYMFIADSLNAIVCPVGWAFRQSRIQYPLLELYMADHNHPSDTGTYLAAATFYSTIYQDSSVSIPNYGNIGSTTAIAMQHIASHMVMDSLSLWNIGQNLSSPIADFSFSANALAVAFTDSSINASSYLWLFGDGNYSTQKNPVHNYPHQGNYNVKMVAYNSCSSDTITKTILLSTPPLNAEIRYTDLIPNTIVSNTDTFLIDINSDGIDDLKFTQEDTATGIAASGIGVTLLHNNIEFIGDNPTYDPGHQYPFKVDSNNLIDSNADNHQWVVKLGGNDIVRVMYLHFFTSGFDLGEWTGGVINGYLGIRLKINNNWHYGWVRMDVSAGNASQLTIKDYAFNTVVNEKIHAGQKQNFGPSAIATSYEDSLCGLVVGFVRRNTSSTLLYNKIYQKIYLEISIVLLRFRPISHPISLTTTH